MNPGTSVVSSEPPSEARRKALLTLMGDEDGAIYQTVRTQILSLGPSVREWLRPHLLSDDPLLRRRVREVFDHFGRQTADNRFLAFCLKQGEDLDLEAGAFLLAQTRHPDAPVEACQAQLDLFADTLRGRASRIAGAKCLLNAINKFLFVEQGFAGNERDAYNPEFSYLTSVMDSRRGVPISLCVIYLCIARRLHLPVSGIGLPGHFVCRFQSSTEEIYVDCFNRGRLMTKADCISYLLSGNHDLREETLQPLSPRRILMRMCGNLHRTYYHHRNAEETTRLQRYLVALAR